MDTNDMLYHLEDGLATITINLPQVLNALGSSALRSLTECLLRAQADHNVLGVVIHAAGEKAFCVGGDIKEEVEMDGTLAYDFGQLGQNLIRTLLNLRVPVITAVHGYALWAGMAILLDRDFAFLSPASKLPIPYFHLGHMRGFF